MDISKFIFVFGSNLKGIHGKAAGHIRNQAMSWYSTYLIAFWDGCSIGTENMATTAKRDGLKVRVIKI